MLQLKAIRLRQCKTQTEIADYLKIARASYANIENGKRDPDTQTLLALADYFGISIDEIFGRKPAEAQFHVSDDEKRLLSDFRSLNRQGQDFIRQALYTAVQSDIYKNNNDVSDMEVKGG